MYGSGRGGRSCCFSQPRIAIRVNGNILAGNLLPSAYTAANDKPVPADPNLVCGMDEDYDACDLENWFLAIQSADGQVVVPGWRDAGLPVTTELGDASYQAQRKKAGL